MFNSVGFAALKGTKVFSRREKKQCRIIILRLIANRRMHIYIHLAN